MNHIPFDTTFTTALLIKQSGLNKEGIERTYVSHGLPTTGLAAFDLDYDGKKKPSAKVRKAYLEKLLKGLDKIGVLFILCCDTEYFKTLTGIQKVEPCLGYMFPVKDYPHIHVSFSYNHQVLFYKPDLLDKIKLSITTLNSFKQGNYIELGSDIIHSESYPESFAEIRNALAQLHQYDAITADFETFSLKHYDSGIGTVAFAWNKHEGVAFCVDYKSETPVDISNKGQQTKWKYASESRNEPVRALLKEFFETYQGKIIWHNITYDAYIAVYQLWMTDLLDQEGLLTGLDIMTKKFDCTKLITYLATNSCAGNRLSLKEQAHEYAGAWAVEDIKDITLVGEPVLLRYNLVDCLSTWYVHEKNYPIMVMDNQKDIYQLFKEFVLDIIQMQLTGFCLSMPKVLEAEYKLTTILNDTYNTLINLPSAKLFIQDSIDKEVITRNAEYKTKVITSADALFEFNPNSNPQMQEYLYNYLALPVVDLTKTKQPAVGNKTLDKITKLISDPEKLSALNSLIDYIKVGKLLSAFIPAFKLAPMASDGYHYLYGSFNLGGTLSGRLSSSSPNLQNIPSSSTYAKIIKECFIAPKGLLFCGADSASLEDRIDTLLTNDPNKEKIYIDGFDGHCLRAFSYFGSQMADINNSVDSINSIKLLYPDLRQDSKAPTFALTYQGQWFTLVKQCGFSEVQAKQIEYAYHDMYEVSDKWKADKITKAAKDGFSVVAFGLKVRTPILSQVVMGNNRTPYEAEAEARTIGNAFGQSYGLMNSRSSMAIMKVVRGGEHRLDIKLVAHIHDAIYFRVPDDFKIIKYLNDLVGKEMSWQELPELQHDKINLSGELDLFYPHWGKATTLANYISADEIRETCIIERDKRLQV